MDPRNTAGQKLSRKLHDDEPELESEPEPELGLEPEPELELEPEPEPELELDGDGAVEDRA